MTTLVLQDELKRSLEIAVHVVSLLCRTTLPQMDHRNDQAFRYRPENVMTTPLPEIG